MTLILQKLEKIINSELSSKIQNSSIDNGDTAIGSGFKFPLVISTSIKANALRGRIKK